MQNIGIFRKIPLWNSITRTDGTESRNRAKITNISVSENYKISREEGYEVIKIGSSSKTIKGMHTYTIKYTYDIGKDPLKDADELYYNLIGNEWDAKIKNVKFRITMPKTFDESLLGFSSGLKGSTDSENIWYGVDGNDIYGYVYNDLNIGHGLTIRLTLPEGYFIRESSDISIYPVVAIMLSIIMVIIAYSVWKKYGERDDVIETVEFYPPDGCNSADVCFLYKGRVNTEGAISLLIYLADKGYLRIEQTAEKEGLSKKSKEFKIIKVKEYDGNDENEKLFFDGLFTYTEGPDFGETKRIMKEAKQNGEKISFIQAEKMTMKTVERKKVTRTDLYNKFHTTLTKIENNMNSKENINKIYEADSRKKIKWFWFIMILILGVITIQPLADYGVAERIIPAMLYPLIGITIFVKSIMKKSRVNIIIGTMFFICLGLIPIIATMLQILLQDTTSLIMYIVGLTSVIIVDILSNKMPKRTEYGNEMLGKIKGFRRFLETAEKEQLEELVEQNPEYFYNILPYTYALGVSDKWVKQFEEIAVQSPTWYVSDDNFNMKEFSSFMTSTMSSVSTATSSNSSGSGGGSSGGGSGGGGGGSW